MRGPASAGPGDFPVSWEDGVASQSAAYQERGETDHNNTVYRGKTEGK